MKAAASRRSLLLRGLFLTLLVAYVAWHADFTRFVSHFDLKMLAAAAIIQPLVAVAMACGARRIVILCAPSSVRLRVAFRALVLSIGMNMLVPGRLAEVLKATYLRDHAGVALSAGFAAVIMERLLDLVTLCLIIAAAAAYAEVLPNAALGSAAIAGIAGLVVMIRFRAAILRGLERLPWPWVTEFGQRLLIHLSRFGTLRTTVPAFVFGVLMWLVSFLKFMLFLNIAADNPISIEGALFVFAAAMIGGAIPALPGGIGTYEAAIVFALGKYGYGFDEALSLAIGLRVGLHMLILPGALAIASRHPLGLRSVVQQISVRIAER